MKGGMAMAAAGMALAAFGAFGAGVTTPAPGWTFTEAERPVFKVEAAGGAGGAAKSPLTAPSRSPRSRPATTIWH